MNICFILPSFSRRPIGGYKIVFEYANRFVSNGYNVYILFINENSFEKYRVPKCFKKIMAKIVTKIEPRWFPLDKAITKFSSVKDCVSILNKVDVCIATGAETVEICSEYFSNSKKFYFIQGFETWVMSENDLYKTYNSGLKKIVISNWLKKIVDGHSIEKSTLIKNPIDLDKYRIIKPLEKRYKHTVGFLYHSDKNKGTIYSIEAIKHLIKKYPDLKVYAFGTTDCSEKIPGLVKFIKNASIDQTIEIYNEISVFMYSAVNEGYGLTPMEAMACGAAVASTNYEGIREYGMDEINCLLSPVCDSISLAKNVSKLFDDDELRYKLARNGIKSLKPMSWDNAFEKFKNEVNKA